MATRPVIVLGGLHALHYLDPMNNRFFLLHLLKGISW
jgi:hypothetical protein